jgi:diphthamide biosynthesis enzyme Dph1/Dph2-like protein
VNKALMRRFARFLFSKEQLLMHDLRYFLVQKAKEAQVVGILAGTLGVANYLEVIERLQKLVAKAGKTSYSFVVGKINQAKLANFMEIDVFVLVACPENSLVKTLIAIFLYWMLLRFLFFCAARLERLLPADTDAI